MKRSMPASPGFRSYCYQTRDGRRAVITEVHSDPEQAVDDGRAQALRQEVLALRQVLAEVHNWTLQTEFGATAHDLLRDLGRIRRITAADAVPAVPQPKRAEPVLSVDVARGECQTAVVLDSVVASGDSLTNPIRGHHQAIPAPVKAVTTTRS